MTATASSLQADWNVPWESTESPEEDRDHREARFEAFIEELLPVIQRRHPGYTDERILETAIHLAAFRLKNEAVSGSADHAETGAGGEAMSNIAS